MKTNTPSIRTVPWTTYTGGPATPPPELAEPIQDLPEIAPDCRPVVAVIGCGYVGSHLVHVFGQHFDVIAFDISAARMKVFAQECSAWPSITCTTNPDDLATATHYLLSIPTLLTPDKQSVDTSHLQAAIKTVLTYARSGSTIVVESSVAVGMTRSLLEPLVKDRGIMVGMSPERVDPGRTWPALEDVPKLISGLTPASLESIARIYSPAFHKLVKVSSCEVAEMTKLYENCQRMVCIAFANEMADACAAHNINPYEVTDAASTKPFGFMPFAPGLGVGGHCIPVNPSYLFTNNNLPVLKLANDRMQERPGRIAEKLVRQHGQSRVLVIGTAFKPGQSVISCSPSIMLASRLRELGCQVQYLDPLVPQSSIPTIDRLDDNKFTAEHVDAEFDLVVLGMKQHGIDYTVLKNLQSAAVESYVDLKSEPASFLRRESRCR